jgi:hypothetical protein
MTLIFALLLILLTEMSVIIILLIRANRMLAAIAKRLTTILYDMPQGPAS